MGRLRARLEKLQKAARGQLDSFELADGTRYWFSPEQGTRDLFEYWTQSLRAVHHQTPRPEPPEILHAVSRARDREQALRAVEPEGISWLPLDREALVRDGALRERPLVADRLEAVE